MLEQLKFSTGKLNRLPTALHLIRAQIHFHITKRVAVLLLRYRLCSPQNGFDAGEQLPNREGLGDVIIGPKFETYDLIYFLSPRGKHDDGNRGSLCFELLAY